MIFFLWRYKFNKETLNVLKKTWFSHIFYHQISNYDRTEKARLRILFFIPFKTFLFG